MEKVLNAATVNQLREAVEKINDTLYKAIYYLDVCIVASQTEEDRACPLSIVLKDIQDWLYKIPEHFEPFTSLLEPGSKTEIT